MRGDPPAQRLDAIVAYHHHVFGVKHSKIFVVVPHRIEIKDLLGINMRAKNIAQVHKP
jgi:hypothetical protein